MAKSYSDQELIERIKAGGHACEEAMGFIYKQYVDEVVAYLTRRQFDGEEARDVVQDAVINLLMGVQQGKFLGNSSLKTYLYAISKNLWLRRLRRKGTEDAYIQKQDETDVDHTSPEVLIMEEDQRSGVSEILAKLKERCREVLLMWSQKYSMKEIAQTLGYSNDQVVRNKKNHCMKELKEKVRNNPHIRQLIHDWVN
ncbi:MAG: sigma-70 family RNA polymerase sigma factor [Bacteroidia bacterium]|nr:sigma-70 family RNA polymerase sigma factor [Bacteroidia bacterium]